MSNNRGENDVIFKVYIQNKYHYQVSEFVYIKIHFFKVLKGEPNNDAENSASV